jgi:ribosomal protein L18E
MKLTDVSEVLAASMIRAIALMMKPASTSETSVNFYQATRHIIPEDTIIISIITNSRL